jgi:hypothetical protein
MADSSSKVLPVRTNFVGVVGDMRRDMEGHHYAGRGGRKERRVLGSNKLNYSQCWL